MILAKALSSSVNGCSEFGCMIRFVNSLRSMFRVEKFFTPLTMFLPLDVQLDHNGEPLSLFVVISSSRYEAHHLLTSVELLQ